MTIVPVPGVPLEEALASGARTSATHLGQRTCFFPGFLVGPKHGGPNQASSDGLRTMSGRVVPAWKAETATSQSSVYAGRCLG